jgi:guanylate kinase
VSVTTRAPRPGEADGTEYHFITDSEFEQMVANDELLEWATFAGNKYGTPKAPVLQKLREGVPTLLEIDLAGARQVRQAVPGARLIFLAPPSWDELVRRLTSRRTEHPEAVAQRLAAARTELAAESEFDITLVNTSVEDVCQQLVALVTAPAGQELKEGAQWQALPLRKASSTRPSTTCSRWWTASTPW